MAKADTRLQTRNARRQIATDEPKKLHTTKIFTGLALGYRRGSRGGTWIARRHEGGARYSFEPLGLADDDPRSGDGRKVLSFDQAQEAAREWYKRKSAEDAGEVQGGPYTVEDAVGEYVKSMGGRKGLLKMQSVARVHILAHPLAKVELAKLRHFAVRSWLDALAASAPRVRAREQGATAFREMNKDDPDAARKRLASANRVWTVLRAALNHAYAHNRVATKAAWDKVKPFREANAAKVRYLTMDEARRLLAACSEDFGKLVRAALMTGCRYGELCAMRAADYSADAGAVHVPRSKSGKDRHVPLSDEGRAFFAALVADCSPKALMFTHASGPRKGEGWKPTQQTFHIEVACERAGIAPAIGFHILRHTYASQLAMGGTPMVVIAQALGHVGDTRMVERHYAHLSRSYIAEQVRTNLPSFGI